MTRWMAVTMLGVVIAGCASSDGPRSRPGSKFEREAMTSVLRAGFGEIRDKSLVERSAADLFIAGLKDIVYLDSALRFEATPENLVLSRAEHVYPVLARPADDDLQGWVTASLAVFDQARRISPIAATADREALYQFMFDGALASVDPYSRYSGNRNARANRAARNGFIGIGIEYDMDPGGALVSQVIADSPAEEAGLKTGDLISAVEGKTLVGVSRETVQRLISGPPDTTIKLTVFRSGAPAALAMATRRGLIVPHTVDWNTTPEGVAVIEVHSFNARTSLEVSQAVAKAKDRMNGRLKGIVLDLRGDPGGLLDQAVDLSDLFLDGGSIVTLSGRHPGAMQYYAARPGDIAEGVPLVVLVDGKSASSSEIAAAALADNGRALTVGTNTLGKGSVQTLIRLPNDGEIALTWAEVLSPAGYRVHGLGLLPAICTSNSAGPLKAIVERVSRREAPWRALPAAWRADERTAEALGQLRGLCPAQSRQEEKIDETLAVRVAADPALYAQASSHSLAANQQPADSK